MCSFPFGILFKCFIDSYTAFHCQRVFTSDRRNKKDSEHFIYMNSCPSKEQSLGSVSSLSVSSLLPPTREAFWIRVLHCDNLY